ncbi:MAG: hypothetical protein HQ523_12500 [Lentisphaerae bacterium]|nr:hypothetical protein [Lentisphaerota bacterium]
MNSRERVRLILNHEEADRPAIDLGAMSCSGICMWIYRDLKRALGIAGDRVTVGNLQYMLAHVEDAVLDALGCDFVPLPGEVDLTGVEAEPTKPFTFWDGQTFEVPVGFDPAVGADGSLNWRGQCMPQGGRFLDPVPAPAAPMNEDAPAFPPESEWHFETSLPDEFLRAQEARARALYERTDRAIMACPWQGALFAPLVGAIEMLTEPETSREHIMRQAEAVARCNEQYLQAVGPYIDVLLFAPGDYGYQDRESFNPDLMGEFWVPAWRLVTDVIHRFPHVKVFCHSCGSNTGFMPHYIAAGIDIFNPVQWTAQNMDPRWLKREFGDQLTFWGGAVSTQHTLPFGSPDEVRQEAEEMLSVFAPGGGYVFNAIHNILAEVPIENIVALYEAGQRYRYS